MSLSIVSRSGLIVVAVTLLGTGPSPAAAPADMAAVANTIKADVAEMIAGINAHDADKATAFDAADVVFMECGDKPTVGAKADREAFREHFAQDPSWKVDLISETVDVAGSGDLAVYRGTYNEDNRVGGMMMTHKTNFIAEFRQQAAGTWKLAWEIVSGMEKSHPKT